MLSLSLTGLRFREPGVGTTPRGLIEWAAAARPLRPVALALDATAPGLRARELDRSARRDLAATLRRQGFAFTGLDFFIPPSHFTDPAHADRALAALAAALELASDLARHAGLPPGQAAAWVTTEMPEATPADVRATLAAASERVNTTIANLTPAASDLVALDPAALLLKGEDPATAAAKLGSRLAAPRLSDATAGTRVAASQGTLDLLTYHAATASARSAPCLDLRQLPDAAAAMTTGLEAWQRMTAAFHAP